MLPDFRADPEYAHCMDQPAKIPRPPWKPKFSNVAYWTKNLAPPADVGVPGDVWGRADPYGGMPSLFVRSADGWVAVPDAGLVMYGPSHPLNDNLTLCFDPPDRVVWAAQSTAAQVRRRYATTKLVEGIGDYFNMTCSAFAKLRYQLSVAICEDTDPPLKPYPDIEAARKDKRGPAVRKRPKGAELERARKRIRLSESVEEAVPSSTDLQVESQADANVATPPTIGGCLPSLRMHPYNDLMFSQNPLIIFQLLPPRENHCKVIFNLFTSYRSFNGGD